MIIVFEVCFKLQKKDSSRNVFNVVYFTVFGFLYRKCYFLIDFAFIKTLLFIKNKDVAKKVLNNVIILSGCVNLKLHCIKCALYPVLVNKK